MNSPMLEPEEHVLSTLERDGARRWLRPKLSPGKLFHSRRYLAYFLIFVFTIIPFIRIGGKPLLLLDIIGRKFTIFGYTFLPTDTLLLALFLVGGLLTVFLMTAIFGRVWCGWACPQTVYMEFVFRPIERLLDGTVGRGGEPKKNRANAALRWAVRYLIYLVICFYLANTFLAYFVGTDELLRWVRQSPFEHPVPFIIVGFVTVMMMFDFSFFREQMCIIACPYGRFQSVLLDRNSLIVSYDHNRGEPRGKAKKQAKKQAEQPKAKCSGNCDGNCKNKDKAVADTVALKAAPQSAGDCVDCGLCVTTCPTGIDIRNGLQMECINCTQCIDACNAVMVKLGRPKDLIRYSSQSNDDGQSKGILRPRVVIYPLLLSIVGSLFLFFLMSKGAFDVSILRDRGNPYTVMPSGLVRNVLKLKLANRQEEDMVFQVEAVEPVTATLKLIEPDFEVKAQENRVFHLNVDVPRDAFTSGKASLILKVTNQLGQEQEADFRLQGPMGKAPATSPASTETATVQGATDSDSADAETAAAEPAAK